MISKDFLELIICKTVKTITQTETLNTDFFYSHYILTGDGQLSDILLQLNVEVLIPSHCVDLTMLDGGKDYSHGYVVEGDPKICAGGIQGQDTCSVSYWL